MWIATSLDDEIQIPLAADPEIIEANEAAAVAAYRFTSDATDLDVPEGAALVTIRPLSRPVIRMAETSTGRRSHRGELVYSEAMRAAIAGDGADSDRLGIAGACADRYDALSGADAAAYDRHEAWLVRRAREICRRAIVAVDGADLPPHPGGYDVEALEAGIDAFAVAEGADISGVAVITEIAGHVMQIGRSGKWRGPSCRSPSGATTTMPPPAAGDATNAPEDPTPA